MMTRFDALGCVHNVSSCVCHLCHLEGDLFEKHASGLAKALFGVGAGIWSFGGVDPAADFFGLSRNMQLQADCAATPQPPMSCVAPHQPHACCLWQCCVQGSVNAKAATKQGGEVATKQGGEVASSAHVRASVSKHCHCGSNLPSRPLFVQLLNG